MSYRRHTNEGVLRLPPGRDIESLVPVERLSFTLPWQMAGFIAALLLIIIASHFLGGAAGRWAEQQDSGSVATRSDF